MPTPFDNRTIAQIQAAIRAATPDDYAPNAKFYDGDHWQEGCGWIGPQPQPSDAGAAQIMCEIKRAFTSKNAVRETVERHSGGVSGREPAWGLTVRRPLKPGKKPTEAEQELIDEAEAVLTEWWDERGLQTLLQETLATLLLSGRATLRLFVPRGLVHTTEDGRTQLPEIDLRAALFAIYAHQPGLDQATVLVDKPTQQRAGVYAYKEDSQTLVELTAIDEQNRTVLRILRADGTIDEEAEPLDLGGKLFVHELKRPLLISEQVRQLQRQLNLAKTMLGRNVVQGGFLERIILNGQVPGDWIDDPAATATGGKRFVGKPFRVGAGTTNFVSGVPIRDEKGKITGYTNPSVIYRDPVAIDTFEATAISAYRNILEEVHQLHALIGGDATASGESRKQARAEFEQDLRKTATQLDRAVRWLLETTLALAAQFSGQPGRFAELRATCEARIDTGPISTDEQEQARQNVKAELLSPESGMSRIGVEDVDAEQTRIDAARTARQAAAAAAVTPQPATGNQVPTPNSQHPTPKISNPPDMVPA